MGEVNGGLSPVYTPPDENDHAPDLRHRRDDTGLADRIGWRLKEARLRAGLTQQQLAGERYTKAYVSALENGLVRPSMAALSFFADRLRVAPSRLIGDELPTWTRLEADIHLAAGRGSRPGRVRLAARWHLGARRRAELLPVAPKRTPGSTPCGGRRGRGGSGPPVRAPRPGGSMRPSRPTGSPTPSTSRTTWPRRAHSCDRSSTVFGTA